VNRDLYFIERGRDIRHRLTNNPANEWFPVWSPDGRQVAFGSDRVDGRTMFAFRKMALDESAAETRIEGFEEPSDWSRDGWMAGTRASEATKGRKIQVGPANGGERVNLTNTPGSEAAARFSPDSKWVAYSSDETGRSEIYVRPFPGHADSSPARVQISDNGGEYPMWNETGAELYYLSAGDMVFAVNTRALAMGNVAAPAPLFKACPQSQPGVWSIVLPNIRC